MFYRIASQNNKDIVSKFYNYVLQLHYINKSFIITLYYAHKFSYFSCSTSLIYINCLLTADSET